MLEVGVKAPLDTPLEGSDGQTHTLGDYLGKKLILYFYPKDSTPGCTAENISITQHFTELTKLGYTIIGVSPDSIERHGKFMEKYDLKPLLLSDPEHRLADQFGAWGLKKNYGKEYMGLIRSTFIIGADGSITKVYPKVKTKTHGEDLLKDLGELQ